MKKEIPSKEKLIELLLVIRHNEAKKADGEADQDLITACTELLLDLQNKEVTLNPEEVEERVKKIPFIETIDTEAVKKTHKITKKRILLIAAIIAVLIAILSIISIGSERDILDITAEKFGGLDKTPTNVEFYDNGESYEVNGLAKSYYSINELLKKEKPDIILPANFPDTLELKEITVGVEDGHQTIHISFKEGLFYTVHKKTAIPQGVLDNVTPVTIGNTKVYIEDLADVNHYQAHFSYKGDKYLISHSDKQIILKILEDLEVYL